MINSLEVKNPNKEQELAIRHSGGVLLSAGAGSGKTFVLVEHIIYLFTESFNENKNLGPSEFGRSLVDKFSSISLMTFTKKAAGELSLRLQKRFKLSLERSERGMEEIPPEYWKEGILAINYMFVGTIHSFCYRLIRQGFIPGMTGQEELISDADQNEKINRLVELWIKNHIDGVSEFERKLILLNKRSLIECMSTIFSDTDLRLTWSNYESDDFKVNDDQIFELLIESFCSRPFRAFSESIDFEEIGGKKPPKWVEFLKDFLENTSFSDVQSFMSSTSSLLESVKRMPSRPKKAPVYVIDLLTDIKALNDFYKSYKEDLIAYQEMPAKFQLWAGLILNIYSFLEKNYRKFPGLTFTDLEYFSWSALKKNKEVREECRSNFKYFIVDEFQDTSNVQFEIIKMIIDQDYKKVFCVGDVKQAIYGFRGGELGVFSEASENIYKNLYLKNNYRSKENIIKFNNQLFSHIFPLGRDFENLDKHSIEMMKQEVPIEYEDQGTLKKLYLNVSTNEEDNVRSLSSTELNYLESKVIIEYLKSCPQKDTCILYRKLTPTKFLLPLLLESDMGFTCQIKVPFNEDPLLAIFLEFIKGSYFISVDEIKNYNTAKDLCFEVLRILNFQEEDENFSDTFSKHCRSVSNKGSLESFKNFIWELSLSHSLIDLNLPLIELMCTVGRDNAQGICELFQKFTKDVYSIDFQYGKDPTNIKIMSAHASKGLEFEKVILGGIHTNGSDIQNKSFFGKIPLSFKWFSDFKKSKIFKSPYYIYELLLQKEKAFSEAKRLFYVAGTRAVETLIWPDISLNEKPSSYSGSSWINGIREWETHLNEENVHLFENIKSNLFNLNLAYNECISESMRVDLKPPAFHQNSLGLSFNEAGDKNSSLAVNSELSVTRLSQVLICERKFLLKNIFKLKEEESSSFEVKQKEQLPEEGKEEFLVTSVENNASRGTLVHEALEYGVKHNFTINRSLELDEKTKDGIDWVLNLLREYKDAGYALVPENPVKFSLFGQVISGTPDIVLRGPKGEIEVWDYKTGRFSEEKARPYWFQLKCYGLSELGLNSREQPAIGNRDIRLKLIFVDEKREKLLETSEKVIKSDIFEVWSRLSFLDGFNREHCRFCGFNYVCNPS